MRWTKPFLEISKNDAPIAGGKGASLGEMTQAGIPVPYGFVILSSAFEHFVEETNLAAEIDAALDSVDPKEMHTVEWASEKIQGLILSVPMPFDIASEIESEYKKLNALYVAVRSSATAEDSASAAWAGQLDSFLNTTEETLLKNVQRCFASLFTPRAIFYRFEKELHQTKISVAVVVQKMIESEVSGIAFSVHPVTEDYNQLIIEAGYGLGEAIVSGSITPDSYVVEKEPRRIIETSVNTQNRGLYRIDGGGNEWKEISEPKASSQVLNNEQILSLSEIILRIEKHYGFPCDIEWAYEGGSFYIVQSRPITTLSNKPLIREFQKFFTREIPLVVMEYWHSGEFYGLPKLLNGVTHFNPMFIRGDDGLTNVYYDMNNPDTALEPLFNFFKHNPRRFYDFVGEFEKLNKKLNELIDNFKFDSFTELFDQMVGAWSYHPLWNLLGTDSENFVSKDLIDTSLKLRDEFQEIEYKVSDLFVRVIGEKYPEFKYYADVISFEEASSGNIPSIDELKSRKRKLIYFEGQILTDLSNKEFSNKFQINIDEDLAIVGEKNFGLDQSVSDGSDNPKQQFIKAYTRNFSIIMQEAWFDANKSGLIEKLGLSDYPFNPPYLYFMKDGVEEVWENTEANSWLLEKLTEKIETNENFFTDTHKRYFDRLSEIEKLWKKDIRAVGELKEFIKLVSEGVADFVILYGALMNEKIEHKYKEMAKKFREKDVFFAECNTAILKGLQNIYPELGYFVMYITREELGTSIDIDEVKKRDKGFVLIPGIFTGKMSFDGLVEKFPEYIFNIETGEYGDDGLKGQTAYKGKVRGIVRVVKRKDQIDETQTGEVIVSPMTTPDFLPAMHKAAAFVTDEGGVTCHAAIIAREMQKPCIIGTKIATQVLKDGDLVEVDADNGIVRIIERAEKKEAAIYEKIFMRDFCLSLVEAWCRAESTDPRMWTDKQQPKVPYIIFEKKGDAVSCYMDTAGIDWIKRELSELVSRDPAYVQHTANRFVDATRRMSLSWDKDEVSSLDELKTYLKDLRSAWVWFEAVWWLMEVFHDDEEKLKILMPARVATEKIGDGSDTLIKNSLRKFFPQLGDLVDYLLGEEIERGDIPSPSELEKRKSGYIYTNARLFVGRDITDVEEEFSIKIDRTCIDAFREKSHVSGKSAYGGTVRGMARVILSKNQIPSLQGGEVLVTSMTTPDFLPALQKAAAFVTDEGGITCHAAIVAREMKKPCIIGTKIATQVLKDGDLVEVDADHGVVRIIERANNTKTILTELIHINAPISVAELTNRGETPEQVPWSANKFLFKPYCVFERREGQIYYWYDQHGVDWKTSEAGKFDEQVLLEKVATTFAPIKEIIHNEPALSQKEFEKFIACVGEFWPWLECLWWMIEYRDKNGEEVGALIRMRKETEHFVPGLIATVRNSIKHIFPGYAEYADVLLLDEVLGDALPSREVLQSRMTQCVYVDGRLFNSLSTVEETLGVKCEKPDLKEGADELRGQVAYGGRVKGKIRHVRSRDDIGSFVDGEIILSSTTTPDFLPAMKRSSAIISEHGGAICHAAITSRELEIPCVVGVRHATQVLKDGDLVEVDADNGVVKVLNKSHGNVFLSKIFSREKALFYFSMWNDSDRLGWKNFLGYDVKNNLFIIPTHGQKGSVWYSQEELNNIDLILKEKLKTDKNLILKLKETLDANWSAISPYLLDGKKILSVDEFENYYKHLVEWWSAMNTAFGIPDMEDVSKDVRDIFLSYRIESEKFTEKMNKVLVEFWNEKFPGLHDLAFFVAPSEVRQIEAGSNQVISDIRERMDGCFMLNHKIYQIKELHNKLQEFGLSIDQIITDENSQIKGTLAYKGNVLGRVKKILSFKDMKNFKEGEILVTEMTNPEYLPIMRIASAVITDEGGTTCHAGIACRELKIPCIVGTKIATQVLHDGDLVEVDADNGVVRVVEKV